MLQHATGPERDGVEMPVNTHASPPKVFGSHDIGVQSHHDTAVIESAMREHWNGCYWNSAALEPQIQRDLQLTSIELKAGDESRVTLR